MQTIDRFYFYCFLPLKLLVIAVLWSQGMM